MANKKITELDAITTLASTDVVPVVDVSADTTNKITTTNLFRTLPDGTAAAPALAFSSDAANGVYLAGTDTVGISTGGTQRVTVDGSGNVTISGGLTVEGQTTTVESTIVTIDDKNIELGSVASPSNTTADGGGITLKGATDKTIKWINSTGYWTFNTGIEVGGHLQIDDNNEIRVGTSQDLKISHNGTNSVIADAGNGNLSLQTNDGEINFWNSTDLAYMVKATGSGSVELFHAGTKKFETKSDGIDVVGEVQCDSLDVDGTVDITGDVNLHANLDLQDDDRLRIGSSDDLQLRHNGTDSHIQNDTGSLFLTNYADDKDITLRSDDGSGDVTNYIVCDGSDGNVRLYHYGTQKLGTKSDGIDVTGEVQCDSLDVDGALDIDGGQLTFDAANNRLNLADNVELRVGTGSDLRIYHNGTNTHLSNTTGGLYIDQNLDDGDIILRSDNGSGSVTNYIACDGSAGEVRLYHYGSEKLNTSATGISVTGQVNASTMHLTDGNGIHIGNSNDLQIYHDGSNSYIKDAGSGDLIINATNLQVKNHANNAIYFTATNGGAFTAYHNNVYKFATKSDGVNVIGELECDSLDVDGAADITGEVNLHNNLSLQDNDKINFGGGNDLQIFHDGTNSYVKDIGTGNLSIQSNGSEIQLAKGGTFEHMVRAIVDGAVELYYDNVKKFETKSDGIDVAGEVQCNSLDVNGVTNIGAADTSDAQLEIGAAATGNRNAYVDLIGDTTYTDYGLRVQRDNGGANGASKILHRGTGDFRFVAQEAAAMEFFTSNSERLRIDSSGRLLLGTTTEGSSNADDFTVANSGNGGITIRTGTSSSGQIAFSDGTSGNDELRGQILYNHSSNYMRFQTDATERFRITSTGAWAIEGGSNYGTSGQVLTSNGNDSPTWQDAGAASVGGSSAISMNDNVKINFGDGNDLQIYHDGSNSYIKDAGTGNLFIQGSLVAIQSTAGETIAKFTADAASVLNYDGSQKLTTKSDGVDITGELQCDTLDVDGQADISSNVIIGGELNFMGASDGNKYIDARLGTGTFHIRGTSGGDANHTILAKFTRTGPVELFHNNSQKFATKADGIDVTGEVQCDSLDVDGGANILGTAVFQGDVGIGNVTPGNSFDNGKSLALGDNDTGIRQNGDGILELWSNNAQCFRVRNTGNISYEHLLPGSNNTYDLGSSSTRWRNVYTNDLNLSNEGSGNDVDGTWGNYTIQEGEDDLFLINRRNGKKYKFNLTEVS